MSTLATSLARTSSRDQAVKLTFSATILVSAALMFMIEPMFAKLILPVLGGAAGVWNACMMFFQVALLLAYLYAQAISGFPAKTARFLHCAAAALGLLVLPVALRADWIADRAASHPIVSTLALAATTIGLPFFFIATTSPLMQAWFSRTEHQGASDPYFLYAASNLGSLLGLAAYPIVIEPLMPMHLQTRIWSACYLVFLMLTIACAVSSYHGESKPRMAAVVPKSMISARQKAMWFLLAFVPASLLFGVTSQLLTDLPSMPLLWVLPLGIYLLTFIGAFSRGFHGLPAQKYLPLCLVASVVLFIDREAALTAPLLVALIQLGAFAVIAYAMQVELANRRPDTSALTSFYLWMSLGGACGGVVNVIAPSLFQDVWEFPLTLVLGALVLVPRFEMLRKVPYKYERIAGFLLLVCCVLAPLVRHVALQPTTAKLCLIGLLALAVFSCLKVRQSLFGIALLLVVLSFGRIEEYGVKTLYQARSFFGVYRVQTDEKGKWHIFWHGTTLHGTERIQDLSENAVPVVTSYYGPLKSVFALNHEQSHIAVVGLGAGTLACATPHRVSLDFYEIDSLVETLALDPNNFNFVHNCATDPHIVIGDARLTLRIAAKAKYDTFVLDAFSSDAIPMHLLTREAGELYAQKLSRDGVMVFHLSNRHLDLRPVVAALADDLALTPLILENKPTRAELENGEFPSRWVALSRSDTKLAALQSVGWKPLRESRRVPWTDDYSSIVHVISWHF